MGGRADLRGPRGRPLHLLRRQEPPTVGPGDPGRRARTHPRRGVEAQLLGLRAAQADQGGPPGRPRPRSGPGGASHALPGHPRRQPGEETLHHQFDPAHVRAPDLVNRNFHASRPGELWVCDFTYCSTWSGIVYVTFVIDVFSRRLVGWKAARSMTTTLGLDALNMAAWTRRHSDLAGLRCHSDAGSQYTAIAHTECLEDVGAAPLHRDDRRQLRQRHGRVGDRALQDRAAPQPGRPRGERTEDPGRASTTSGSPPVPGCRGSTRSGSTGSLTTARRPKSKPSTVSDLSPL